MLTHGIPPDFHGDVHLFINCHTPSGRSRVYRAKQLRTDGVHGRKSAGTGPIVLKVVSVTGAAFAGHHVRINVRLRYFQHDHLKPLVCVEKDMLCATSFLFSSSHVAEYGPTG